MIHRNILLALALASILFSGCAATTSKYPTSGIRESRDVTLQYRSLEINPGYHYYYAGTKMQPDAIMGIQKGYKVVSDFWHPVDLTAEQLEYWVTWGDRERADEGFSSRYLGRYVGAYIQDPSGKTIGDWYSKKDLGIFEFPGEQVVIPHPPRNRAGSEPYYRF